VLPIAVAWWGLGYLVLRNSPRAAMLMTVLMVPVFWLLRSVGYVSLEAAVLGIGGVGMIFVRHLTQLHRYDLRAAAE
jgi:hypothetical protein